MTVPMYAAGCSAPPDPVLILDRVSKRLGTAGTGVQALCSVSLTVSPGEFVAVMGPSGSGKSTLVQMACGLMSPDDGAVLVDGRWIATNADWWAKLRRQRIGVVFQRLNLVPSLTALENVMAPLLLDGWRVRDAKYLARQAMDELAIGHLEKALPPDLSGGEEQRVAIARAIVGDRRILLTDEPTGALDSTMSDEVVRLLAARAASGCAVLMVTHDAAVASWADRIVFLRDGSIVGSPVADGTAAPLPLPTFPAGAVR